MASENQTLAINFVLLGFSKNKQTNIALFLIFLVIYLITCFGNLLICIIITMNLSLHKPMYFFLCNLSFVDLCYSSNAAPKLLADLFSIERIISLSACSFQIYFSLFIGATECLLLALMAYDRYAAICRPLHYNVIMNWNICILLTVIIWVWSFIISVIPSLVIHATFCNPNKINHFMCESLAVMRLVCDNIYLSEITTFCMSFIVIFLPFILILMSYICILSSILQLDSVSRHKAFSTCTSHLTVVGLYYSSAMSMYSVSSLNYLADQQKYVSVIYVLITPMLNPVVYCLKNREVKEILRKYLVNISAHCIIKKGMLTMYIY